MTRTLGDAAMGHVRHRTLVSPGALEAFADCPVKWLVERQLEPAELASDAAPLVRGQFMHDVLERVVARLAAPITPATLPEAERIVDQLTAELPDEIARGEAESVRRSILRGIVADLRRYLRHEAVGGCGWTPRALELRFGFDPDDSEEADSGGQSLPGLVIGSGEDAVTVRGVIDRIDVDATGTSAIVRDYKSGANRPERAAAHWIDSRQFQVGLYMLAAQRLLGLKPAAGFYQPLTGGELRARGAYAADAGVGEAVYATDALDRVALDELLAEIERQAVATAAALRAGELTPCPATCGRDGCRHPGICWAA